MFKILALLVVAGVSQAALTKDVQTKSLLCDVCVDVVTDVDQWITSDHTIDEIVHFVEGVSKSFILANDHT